MTRKKKLQTETDVEKDSRKTEQKEMETEGHANNLGEKLKKHFEEPLFTIAIAAVLLAIIKPLIDFSLLTVGILLLGAISAYFVYIYFKNNIKNYYFIGVPVLIFCITLFSYYADQGNAVIDFTAFSVMFAILLLFYTLWIHKIIKKLTHALIATIFICTMLTHLMGAFADDLAALDPYYYFRMADHIVETGDIMEHDNLVYPPEGVDRSRGVLMASVFMAAIANVLSPLGFSIKDVAILYPGVVAAFTVLVLYLLVRDLFSDMKPYNYVAAILAAFMLMLTPGFAEKAIATNCEDDTLGMFLMVSSFLLMTIGFRRRNLKITLLAGFSFLMLAMTWSGYSYAGPVTGVFIVLYAIMNFIHKKNTVKELPYFIIPFLISFLSPLVLHARGELPAFAVPGMIILIPIGGAFLFAVILEIIRTRMYGKIVIPEKTYEDKMENLIDRYIVPIGAAGIIIGIIFILNFPAFDYVKTVIVGAEVRDIIGLTTAEQIRQTYSPEQMVNYAVICGSTSCGSSGFSGKYGAAFLLALIMIIILFYLALVKRSMGAAFILAWSVPMIVGIYAKPQYGFVASVPIIALGATIGLLAGVTKKDMESWRIIATILIILVPLAYIPIAGADHYGKLGSGQVLYSGPRTSGFQVWEPALLWLGNQTIDGSATDWSTITWWDYGHWIAAVSKRVSVADNAKNNQFTVQNDAKFHVLVTTEEEALNITRYYNSQYVIIDWTMIGKSHAPHFIATSNLTTTECGFDLGYGQFQFRQVVTDGMGNIIWDSRKEQYTLNEQGGVEKTRILPFIGGPHIGAILFNIKNDAQISSIDIITPTGDKIPWETWRDQNNVSILGVQPLNTILGLALQGQNVNHPAYTTLIYVPNVYDDGKSGRPQACVRDNSYYTKYSYTWHNYNDYMLTKLYLGDHADSYYLGGGPLSLCTNDWCKKAAEEGNSERLKYFKLVDEFDGVGSPDYSNAGYVKVYEIIYPEEIKVEEAEEESDAEGEEETGEMVTPTETEPFVTWG